MFAVYGIKCDMMKPVLIVLGLLLLSIGFIGIFIPGLPTTPFLLLSTALFFRSSDKLYNRVVSSRLFGKYISDFRKNRGVSLKTKLFSITLMWMMISISIYLYGSTVFRLAVIALGMVGTAVMGFFIKTVRPD